MPIFIFFSIQKLTKCCYEGVTYTWMGVSFKDLSHGVNTTNTSQSDCFRTNIL